MGRLPEQFKHLGVQGGKPVPIHSAFANARWSFLHFDSSKLRFLTLTNRCTVCGYRNGDRDFGVATSPDIDTWSEGRQIRVPDGSGHQECLASSFEMCPYLSDETYSHRTADRHGDARASSSASGAKVLFSGDNTAFREDVMAPFLVGATHRIADPLAGGVEWTPDRDDCVPELLATSSRDSLTFEVFFATTLARFLGGPAPHIPGRNEACLCQSGLKWKRCHGQASVDDAIRADLEAALDRAVFT